MKNIKFLLLTFFVVASLVSCKKDDPAEEVSIVLSVNKETFSVGDVLTFTVVTDEGVNVTNEAEVKLNDEVITNNFQLNSIGDYVVAATYKNASSQVNISIEGAPFTIKVDGVELMNNDVKVYNTVGEDANMELAITNNTSGDINLRMALVSKTVPDTADALVCFDVCYPSIIERTIYPINASYTLAAGATSEAGKAHVQNNDTSFGDAEFVFEVYQVDENLVKIEDGITFTYKYDAP